MSMETYTGITAPRFGQEESEYQVAPPRMPYVHGTDPNNALMHKVNHLRLRWWEIGGSGGKYLMRLSSPRILAVTNCGRWIRLSDTSGKMCEMPKPDAVLCAACHGHGRNFPRGKEHSIPRTVAKVKLGCVEQPA